MEEKQVIQRGIWSAEGAGAGQALLTCKVESSFVCPAEAAASLCVAGLICR